MGIPIIGDVINAVKDLASEVIVDKDKKNDILLKIKQLEDLSEERLHQELMGQIEINKQEASHPSVFVAGWRPFIGWTSGLGIAWTFVLSPFVEFVSRLFGWQGKMPELDTGTLMTLVLAMLGIGAQRSFDKMKGMDTKELLKKSK